MLVVQIRQGQVLLLGKLLDLRDMGEVQLQLELMQLIQDNHLILLLLEIVLGKRLRQIIVLQLDFRLDNLNN